MNKALKIQELAIILTAKNLNPTILNPDFLKYTGIVPADWELAKKPVYTNGVVKILFNNGLGIFAQPNQITLAEILGNKSLTELALATIARKLAEKLSQVEYQAVGINPKGFVTFDSSTAAYQYICHQLLSPGSWQDFGEEKMSAALQLAYPLQRGQLILSINQANIQFSEQIVPVILFSGNCNYRLAGDSPAERSQNLHQLLENWQESVTTFQKLVEEKFLPLANQPATIPVLTPVAIS